MALVHFTEEGFDKALAQGGLLVVDFWSWKFHVEFGQEAL